MSFQELNGNYWVFKFGCLKKLRKQQEEEILWPLSRFSAHSFLSIRLMGLFSGEKPLYRHGLLLEFVIASLMADG